MSKPKYMLVAVIDTDDGTPTDTGGYVLGEFPSQDEAEDYACQLEKQAPEFTLANPPPQHEPWKGEPAQKCRQKVLLTGLDCIAGQQDLF